jgi:predicted TIM-barrel fold metal-dependent hydrolase
MIDFNTHLAFSKDLVSINEIQNEMRLLEKLYISLGFQGGVITNFKEDYFEYKLESQLNWKCFVQCESFDPGKKLWSSLQATENFSFVGVKIHPRNLGWVPSREEIIFALRKSVEFDYLIYICSYLPVGPGMVGSFDFLSRISDAIAAVPSAKVVVGHAGVSDLLKASELARRFDSVYLDLSFLLTRMRGTSLMIDLAWLFNTLDTRILFGSDHPDQSLFASLESFNQLSLELPQIKKDNIMMFNAGNLAGFKL